ncbi:MAG: GntR family transcriptional regulator, partial [Firmicutes bacterium HGW-Firmicutes-3]
MFQVDIRSRIPIYEQMYENIRRLILEGHIKEDEQ